MHPEMTMLTRIALLIARPVADPTREIPAHYDSVSPLHIVHLEPLVAVICWRDYDQIRLASVKMLPTTCPWLAIINVSPSPRSIAAAAVPECSGQTGDGGIRRLRSRKIRRDGALPSRLQGD